MTLLWDEWDSMPLSVRERAWCSDLEITLNGKVYSSWIKLFHLLNKCNNSPSGKTNAAGEYNYMSSSFNGPMEMHAFPSFNYLWISFPENLGFFTHMICMFKDISSTFRNAQLLLSPIIILIDHANDRTCLFPHVPVFLLRMRRQFEFWLPRCFRSWPLFRYYCLPIQARQIIYAMSFQPWQFHTHACNEIVKSW